MLITEIDKLLIAFYLHFVIVMIHSGVRILDWFGKCMQFSVHIRNPNSPELTFGTLLYVQPGHVLAIAITTNPICYSSRTNRKLIIYLSLP